MRKLWILIFAASGLLADGIIIPPHPPTGPANKPVYVNVKYHRVFVDITGNVAKVSVDQVFENPYDREMEGEYLFPVPKGATVSGFLIYSGQKWIRAEILKADEARRIYEDLVRKRKDPALLEFYDQDLLRAKLSPIPPHGEVRVELQYETILEKERGLYKFVYPLKPEALTDESMKELSVEVLIKTDRPVKTVYSPTYDIDVILKKNHAHVSYEAENVRPKEDFILFYSAAPEDVEMNLLTYRKKGKGFFLLTVTPGAKPEELEPIPKDIVFLLDVSGSMLGRKIEQARKALEYFISSLSPEDRFNILVFSTEVKKLKERLVYSNFRAKAEALDFIRTIKAKGGTNINDALLEALSQKEEGERPFYVIFITDGRPTVSVTDAKKILENVKENLGNAKIFVFGVGYDVNTLLLDALAVMSKSEATYVEPDQDLGSVLATFYDKIQFPALTDLELSFGGLEVEKVYPRNLPDLFYGSQLVITGRYRNPGRYTLVLKGKRMGEEVVFENEFVFPEKSEDLDFLPRIWAKRWVGYLLSEIRLNGESKELVDEITELGTKYGIVTPYTSFIVKEAPEYLGREVLRAQTGKKAFKFAKALSEARSSATVMGAEETHLDMKRVRDKVFVFRDGFYYDTQYKEGMKVREIKTGSDEYYRFIREHPSWAPYLSVGDNLVVVLDGVAYKFMAE